MSIRSFSELASKLEVTYDTLRNWQRLGVLPKDLLSTGDIEALRDSLKEQGRLSSRANKLYKNGEDGYRNREGIYYTPSSVVDDMLSTILTEGVEDALFLDPCCGDGNFLIGALKRGFKEENIYGFDTDPEAVKSAKGRLPKSHIVCGDFLELSQSLETRFDYIYTNPPWGKHLDTKLRKSYTSTFDTPLKADTSAIFMVASRRVLKEGGRIGFLVQEAVFNVGAFEWLRERMLKLRVVLLKDYGRPFKGLMTRAQGVVIENRRAQEGEKCQCFIADEHHSRGILSFERIPKKVMNFWATDEDMSCIDRIFANPYKTLQDSAQWGLGIVTGNNRRHCYPKRCDEAEMGVVKGRDILKSGIRPPSLYISRDLSGFQQSAPREIYEAEVKLIYKFISKRLIFFADRKKRYPLNSANCIVVDSDFGATSEQIAELLNSDVVNWLFERMYRSSKVLRGDIETMPLHIDYFSLHENFSEECFCQYLGIEKREDGGYKVAF